MTARRWAWLLVLACAAASAQDKAKDAKDAKAVKDITVVSFGGGAMEAQVKAFNEPFQKSTGIKVKASTYDGEFTELRRMVARGRTNWDVVQTETVDLLRGCEEGLFERLDFSRIGDRKDFIPGTGTDCGVGTFVWSMVIAWNADRVKGTPASWADLWDLKKFPGKRTLRRTAKYTLEIALLADGVAPADLYKVLVTKEGVDRAFRKLDQIKPQIKWWEAAAQAPLYLTQSEPVMGAAFASWLRAEQDRHRSLRMNFAGGIYDIDSWAIPKGTPKLAEAYRYIAFASRPEAQRAFVDGLPYGPTNLKAARMLDSKTASAVPTSEANFKGAIPINIAFWIKYGEELETRFDRWAPPIPKQSIDD